MKYADETVMSFMGIIAQSPSENDTEEAVSMVCALGIAVLRGLRGEEFVQAYLNSAMKDNNAIIPITRGPLQ